MKSEPSFNQLGARVLKYTQSKLRTECCVQVSVRSADQRVVQAYQGQRHERPLRPCTR